MVPPCREITFWLIIFCLWIVFGKYYFYNSHLWLLLYRNVAGLATVISLRSCFLPPERCSCSNILLYNSMRRTNLLWYRYFRGNLTTGANTQEKAGILFSKKEIFSFSLVALHLLHAVSDIEWRENHEWWIRQVVKGRCCEVIGVQSKQLTDFLLVNICCLGNHSPVPQS
jgi:hypothetical protein